SRADRRPARRGGADPAPGGATAAAPAHRAGPGAGRRPGRQPLPATAARAVRPRRAVVRRGRGDPGGRLVRLGTRGSALALAQSRTVAAAIEERTGER